MSGNQEFYEGRHPDRAEPADKALNEPGDDPTIPVFDKAMEMRPWLYEWESPPEEDGGDL